jgi:hypothetical protein
LQVGCVDLPAVAGAISNCLVFCVPAAAWTHFVKSAFAKHGSGDKKAAPSPSLARSIFVTWLNGVPYDARDSSFLNEIKLSAAEYQTHSLAIANSHYDKDAASEAKLRVLVDFCDAYAQWLPDADGDDSKSSSTRASGSASSRLPDNIDSDEDENMSPAPALEAEATVASFAPSDLEVKEVKQAAGAASLGSGPSSGSAAESKEAKKEPPPPPPSTEFKRPSTRRKGRRSSSSWQDSGSSSSDSESESSDGGDEGEGEDDDQPAAQDEAEYLPDRIVAKKTVAWRDFYLIHWLGYTAAERTWEPAPFFDEYCTKQTHDYEQSRRPLRIASRKARPASPGESKSAKEFCFEVQWQGRPASETSMEREGLMREEFPDIVEEWEQRPQEVQSRKHARSASAATDGGGERPAKRRCKGAGAAGGTSDS